MEQMQFAPQTRKTSATQCRPRHVLLVRHGQTDANLHGIVQGHSQTSLNDLGRAQAELLAERLLQYRPQIDLLLSSDLHRALQTAAPISRALNLPIHTDARWRERCYGIFQGMTQEQRREQKRLLNLGEADLPPGAQSVAEFQEQIRQAFLDLLVKFPKAECIAVVTHGGSCRSVLAMLADGRLPMRDGNATVPVDYTPNCSITHVTIHETDGQLRYDLECSQDVEHLAASTVTRQDHG